MTAEISLVLRLMEVRINTRADRKAFASPCSHLLIIRTALMLTRTAWQNDTQCKGAIISDIQIQGCLFVTEPELSCHELTSHVFLRAGICVSSFITITGHLLAVIVPCEQSYYQMNALCKGTQSTSLTSIHYLQLEPIQSPQVSKGELLFSVRYVIMCLWAPVSYDKHNSFPICLYPRVGRKKLELSWKACLFPHNIWLDSTSPLILSLRWCVIMHGFSSVLMSFISLVGTSCKNLLFSIISFFHWCL